MLPTSFTSPTLLRVKPRRGPAELSRNHRDRTSVSAHGPLRPRAPRLRAGQHRDGHVRHGAGAAAASVPHGHARGGRRRGGVDRVRAEGVGRGAQPDRGPDQRPQPFAARSSPPLPAAGRAAAGRHLRVDLRRPHGSATARRDVGGDRVPRVRHGVRVLPGAVQRDAGRDHLRRRRAHPHDDLAGRADRGGDPGLRRDDAAGRLGAGYPAMGVYVGVLLLVGTVGAYLATAGVAEDPTEAPTGPLREQLRVAVGGAGLPPHPGGVRPAGARGRRGARRRRLRLPLPAR